MQSTKKIALVTGASRGIGKACALALGAQDIHVMLADLLDCSATCSEIEAHGGKANALHCDVADESSVLSVFQQCINSHGTLDYLVHAAGVIDDKPLLETSAADFDRVLSVNLRGSFLVGREALRLMSVAQAGRVVMIASDMAYYGRVGFSAYVASKHGVLGLVRSWAHEFAPHININAICPGPIDTDMLSVEAIGAEWREKEKNIPLGRFGDASDIGMMAAFLCGAGGNFITGQGIGVNGGSILP